MSHSSRRTFLRQAAIGGMATGFSMARGPAGAAWSADGTVRWAADEGPNRPLGQARGVCPGRVVWVHEPQVAQWDGDLAAGGWYEDRFTEPVLAARMLSRSLRAATDTATDTDAWQALFRHFNTAHGRGATGYRPGEKVVIKTNMNCSRRAADPAQGLYNTPQLTRALLGQLVEQAGVREEDIVVYDASRLINDSIFLAAHAQFPKIRFEDIEGGDGRFQVQPDKTNALHFGDPETPHNRQTYLPVCVSDATYLINAGLMKGHTLAGVTLCAKNHYGSMYRENTGPRDPHRGWNPSHLHESITVRNRPMGTYNTLVDLMGHKDLGGKTMLYLIDALYAAPHQNAGPQRWQSAPFNNHWTASVFLAQDPVAIESVAVDFFGAEPTASVMIGAVDNYLHEAATADQPASGTRYDPHNGGTPLASLGAHEHWNDPLRRQYSRNLGGDRGIELVTA